MMLTGYFTPHPYGGEGLAAPFEARIVARDKPDRTAGMVTMADLQPEHIIAELKWVLAWIDDAKMPIAAAHLSTVIDLLEEEYELPEVRTNN